MASFIVNGRQVCCPENQKLIRFLRDDLRLLSVKNGCSEGACGTCTVLIDGKAVKACVQQTDRLEGKSIVTCEGLTQRERAVYAYAFTEAGAVQCGFCTPGMVMAAKALLDREPDPTRAQIKDAIRMNICRCTGYQKIEEAILLSDRILVMHNTCEKDDTNIVKEIRINQARPRTTDFCFTAEFLELKKEIFSAL